MKMNQLYIVVVALATVLLQFSHAHAGWDIDKSQLHLPSPPSQDSPADKKDFAILFKYQENRTDEECRAADAQSSISVEAFFGPETGVLTGDEIAKGRGFRK
jgi:hypothetical protein